MFNKAHCQLQLIDLAERDPRVASIKLQMARLCSKIDSEARTLAENDFPEEARDLFMEQSMFIVQTSPMLSIDILI